MNLLATLIGWVAPLADAPVALAWLGKCSAWLGLAWTLDRSLAGRNPRWRVALWRGTIVGLPVIAGLSCLPPLLAWPVIPEVAADLAPGPIDRQDPGPPPPPQVSPEKQEMRDIRPGGSSEAAVAGPGRPVGHWLGPAWAAGVLILWARLILAARRLARIVGESVEAPVEVEAACFEVAGRLGVRRIPPVRVSGAIATPCLAGLLRPVVLLPLGSIEGYGPGDLRAILAHELAHRRAGDLPWNVAAYLGGAVLWFHPLAWRIRRAHTAACDAVADAIAADHLGDAGSYGRTLARLALRVARPIPAPGLAMARGADVLVRIETLHRQVFESPLPRRSILIARSLALLLVLVVGGFALTRAEPNPPAAQAQEPKIEGGMAVRAVEAATDRPLAGVKIWFQGEFDGQLRAGDLVTDRDGRATITWPVALKIGFLKVSADLPKFVPMYQEWRDDGRSVDLPLIQEFRFQAGTTIGGIVRDEAGRAVARAKVSVSARVPEKENFYNWIGFPETDAEGRWRVDEAPSLLSSISIKAEREGYRPAWGQASRNLDSTIVLTKGMAIRGRVLDGRGEPLAGSSVVVGADINGANPPRAVSDGSGGFTLENCDAGVVVVTVQKPGFAPEIRDVPVAGPDDRPVEFRLGPASTLRVRVVDREGRPIVGAAFGVDTWRGRRSLRAQARTDAEGRVAWTSAPRDEVLCDVYHEGHMGRRLVPLVAGGPETTLTMDPELEISGRVTDRSTGRPIPNFRVVAGTRFDTGQPNTRWSREQEAASPDGEYSSRASMPSAAHLVRVEAVGYRSADSRAVRPDEGSITIDFALEPAPRVGGVVIRPDGRPAAGVRVGMATPEKPAYLLSGTLSNTDDLATARSDEGGRFALPTPRTPDYLLIVADDAGFAEASAADLAESRGRLTLQAWGRIEGRVLIAGRPAADRLVHYAPLRPDRSRPTLMYGYDYYMKSDAQGRFRFDRVIPGPGTIGRPVNILAPGRGHLGPTCWPESIAVGPGATANVTVGGRGRAITGRLILDGRPDEPIDWTRNVPVMVRRLAGEPGPAGPFGSAIAADGRFRIEDVPPGRFELTIDVDQHPEQKGWAKIGRVVRPVAVPDDRGEAAIALGAIPAPLFPRLEPGDLAPPFEARGLDGSPIRLADLRGKLVLLDFWASGSPPSLTELPALERIRERHAADPRFALVTLSCDLKIEDAAEHLRAHPIGGVHGFAGRFKEGISADYRLLTIPENFLIGPDGRVIARNLRGEALDRAVAEALADRARFGADPKR